MNYQEMSDFEINCAVGKAISFADSILARNGQLDYCNSWADAGPIIQENKIPLNPFRDAWAAGERRDVKSKNPLRAAMIVLLMMKGGE